MSLAPKLPYDHPFAGGYPRLGGQPLPTDPDAIDYLERVKAADGGAGVEVGVAMAVDAFVKGCKADSAGYAGDPTRTVWDAMKSACIMCGARTLAGALVSLRQYGPELWDAPTPTIVTSGGTSPGSWDAATQTFSCPLGATANTPRFQFDLGLVAGSQYVVSGRLSGDIASVTTTRLCKASCGAETTISYNSSTGVLSGTVTAGGTSPALELGLDATLGPASVRIESLSIKEVINDATNVANNFVAADYDRSGGGLKGDGSTKYLDTNRAGNADGQNDKHLAVYATEAPSAGQQLAGALTYPAPVIGSQLAYAGTDLYVRVNQEYSTSSGVSPGVGFHAVNRSSSTGIDWRLSGVVNADIAASSESGSGNIWIFSRNYAGSTAAPTTARLAFYSIGSSLDLAALDTRVTQLVTGIKFHSLTGLVATDYDPDTVAYIVAAYEAGGTL